MNPYGNRYFKGCSTRVILREIVLVWRMCSEMISEAFRRCAMAAGENNGRNADPLRKLAEEKLQENGAFLDSLLNTMPAPVFYKDEEGRYIGVNKSFENFYGQTSQDLAGKSVFDIAPPELAAIYHAKDLELLRRSGVQVYESQVKDSQGVVHDVVFHKATITETDGTIRGLIGVILDISDRKRAEEAVHSSEIRYHALMEQSFEALAVVDIQTREVVEVNRRFTELIGYSLPKDAPLYVDNFVLDSKPDLDRIYNILQRDQRFLHPEAKAYRHKNGNVLYGERTGTVISLDGREYLLWSLRDMTAERRRQAGLTRDVEFARRVQRALLPELPVSPFATLRTLYHPSNFVSGDSYHLAWRNEGKLLCGFLIDVSGHGLATAIQTSSISVLLQEAATTKRSLVDQLRWINARAAKYFTDDAYAAILGFELDFSLRELRYVGAGITQFYANGRKIETPGMFVGVWEDAEFTDGKIAVKEGDTFCFLTDGFTDRLLQQENAGFFSPDGKDFDGDVAALQRLAESKTLRDDATGVCIRVQAFPAAV